jgi:RNA pseudouridylate synthase
MLNRGHAYTTIIISKYHGRTLLSHLASIYSHSTPQAWQQNLNNCEVTVNGVTATGSESLISGQTLVWNRPPWIEPDTPQHFEVLFDDPHLLAVNKPGGLPTLPGGGFMENTLLRLVQKQTPNANPVHRLGRATTGIVLFAKTPQAAAKLGADWNTPRIQKIYWALAQNVAQQALRRWFWHSCFSRRYSNSVDTALSQDIAAIQQLLTGNTADLDKRNFKVEPSYFTDNTFLLTAVNTKVFVLLLAQAKPKSFISSADVDLENVLVTCNRTEFHHIFPKNYLLTKENITDRSQQFMLANFAFLSQTDNRSIQDKAPAEYLKMIPPASKDSVLASALIPKGGLEMSYKDFIAARSGLLAARANELLLG